MNTRTSDCGLEYYLSDPKPQYESKGQEMIGRMLDKYGIAFYLQNHHNIKHMVV